MQHMQTNELINISNPKTKQTHFQTHNTIYIHIIMSIFTHQTKQIHKTIQTTQSTTNKSKQKQE